MLEQRQHGIKLSWDFQRNVLIRSGQRTEMLSEFVVVEARYA